MTLPPKGHPIRTLDLDTLYYVRESFAGLAAVDHLLDRALANVDAIIRLREGPTPKPHELWEQAEGDRERYVDLMVQHGHLIRTKRSVR